MVGLWITDCWRLYLPMRFQSAIANPQSRLHPVMLSNTVAGCHAQPPEMFSEEYQAEMLAGYIKVLRSKPFVVGEHVWNMCDFRTGQSVRRVGGMNLKGVFTRHRQPKLAAHRLRELWKAAR